jgi:hypothetical protein
MPEYYTPGVYIEEIEIGSKPIAGVSTSTAGFLGEAQRGPTVPTLVTNFPEFQRVFGGYYDQSKFLPYAVQGFFDNGGTILYVARIVQTSATAASLELNSSGKSALSATAVGEGAWGDGVAVKVATGSLSTTASPRFKISVFYWSKPPSTLYDPETDLKSTPRPDVSESFDNLSVDPASTDYCQNRVNGTSNLITLAKGPNDSGAMPDPVAVTLMAGGSDGTGSGITLADYERTDTDAPGKRKGLTGLGAIDGISILYAPNATSIGGFAGLPEAMITQCETLKDRFAIIDAPQGSTDVSGQSNNSLVPRNSWDTSYAAYYYPWIKVVDPSSGMPILVPPGGYMAGIYARVDDSEGVFKAPGNETVVDAADLEFQITAAEQGILNPRGVNVIRAFPGRGILIWGARTLSSDTLWQYINVRRLFIFLEQSIYQGTQWVVFEPNDERLWARVVGSVSEFLTRVWRDGALMGDTADQAFFVIADRSTMTQDDIDNGRLIVMVGVAPVKPAEFVIFRIAQFTGGASS